jgi:flagellar biosynthesis/type III secretory pathway protein FliH
MMIVSAIHDPIIVWDIAQKVERKRRDRNATVETREYIEDMQRLIDFIREETLDEDDLEEARQEGYEEGTETTHEDSYDEGHREGEREGFREGKEEGDREGYERGKDEGYEQGFEAGRQEGITEGRMEAEADYQRGWNQAILYLEEVCSEMRADAIAKALQADNPEALNHL